MGGEPYIVAVNRSATVANLQEKVYDEYWAQKTPEGPLAMQRRKRSEGTANNENLSIVLSPGPVSHLLDSSGNVRTHGHLGAWADEETFVQVYFGHTNQVIPSQQTIQHRPPHSIHDTTRNRGSYTEKQKRDASPKQKMET